jgi:Mg/Co/Ni transporter MgtE
LCWPRDIVQRRLGDPIETQRHAGLEIGQRLVAKPHVDALQADVAAAIVWSHRVPFGLVVGAAMTCAIVTAAAMGAAIPILSKRLGFDPAATTGPFETALQDVVGSSVFLSLATVLARWMV